MKLNELITTKKLSELIGVSEGTISYWRFTRKIPYYRFGKHIRYKLSELLEVMKIEGGNNDKN